MTAAATLHHRAYQLAHGGWAVVHALPGTAHLPLNEQAVAVDIDGFPSRMAAENEAAWMNAERERDTVRWANTAGLCGVRL